MQTSVHRLKTLEALRHQKKRGGHLGGGFPHTAHNWDFRIPHER